MKRYDNAPDEINDGATIRRAFSGSTIKSIDSESRQIEFIISTATADRMGDTIQVNGWDLKNYKANPVVLFGHLSSIPPIGKAVKVWKDKDALLAVAEFMPQDMSAFAHSIFRMYEEKFLRAVSVGFRPTKWEDILDENGERTWSYNFLKQELLEFSAVPIPANPEALVSARQKGIDTAPIRQWTEEMLDRWNETENPLKSLYGVNRKEMETIRRRAGTSSAPYRVPLEVQDEIRKRNLEAIRAAKAAATTAKSDDAPEGVKVTARGLDHTLPLIDKSSSDTGRVVISTDFINEKKVYHIDEAGDDAMFTADLFSDDATDKEFLELEVRSGDGEDDEPGLIVRLNGDDATVEYSIIGATIDGCYYGVKLLADAGAETKSPEEDEEEEEKSKKPKADDAEGDEDEDAKSDDTDESEDDESDGEDKSEDGEDDDKEDDEDEDEDDKKSVDTSGKGLNDDGDEPMEFNVLLHFVSDTLSKLEEALDANGEKALPRRENRHLAFIAGFMRELADRVSPVNDSAQESAKAQPSIEQKAAPNELTADDAQAYLKSLTDSLQPLLTDIVASRISKHRGRLD